LTSTWFSHALSRDLYSNHTTLRLRQKIRVPYQTLEGHVSRLQRLQLASDVLRRTARFVIVARRLEFQMSGVNKATGSSFGPAGGKVNVTGKELNGSGDDGHEGEKERNLAKAALSIAELGG
jgi:conserved oligomeric Golgi complex subunit 5